MRLFHATTPKKAKRYKQSNMIIKPVRGFTTYEGAAMWALRTGRTVIYELNTNESIEEKDFHKLPDHHNSKGEAWWIDSNVALDNMKCVR